jgi:GNAT superfamily N-acetyltransferase
MDVLDVEIREMRRTDAEPLSGAFVAIGWDRPASWFHRHLDDAVEGTRRVWIALVDGEPAGYVTLLRRTTYPPLADDGVPEVADLNVLPAFRRRGIASRLLDVAEADAALVSPIVAIGVGLHAGYNAAQRLYVKRGYVPDGRGVTYGDRFVGEYETVTMDDSLILHLTKDLAAE